MVTITESRTREMQRQLNMVLLLQAIVPFVAEVLPGSFISVNIMFSLPLRYECYLPTILYPWMPVLNPLMALGLIRPYRTAVLVILQWYKGGEGNNRALPMSAVGSALTWESHLRAPVSSLNSTR